jgi:hypothetical protein
LSSGKKIKKLQGRPQFLFLFCNDFANMPSWHLAHFACLTLGPKTIPIFKENTRAHDGR